MNKFSSEFFFVTASHAVTAISMLAVQVIIANQLTLVSYGAFAFAQAFVLIFESVFLSRAGEIALQLIGKAWHKNPSHLEFLVNHLRRDELRWNLVTYLAINMLGLIFDFKNYYLIAILGLTIPLQTGYGVSKATILAAHRVKDQSVFEIAISLITMTAVGIGVWSFGVLGATVGYALSSAIKTVWANSVANRLRSGCSYTNQGSETMQDVQVLHGLSAFAVWRSVCLAVANQADVLIAGATLGNEMVALYKIAKTIAGIPVRIVSPLWVVLRPRLLFAVSMNNRHRAFQLIVLPSLILLFAGLSVSPFLDALMGGIIEMIYGETYSAAKEPAAILCIGAWAFSAVTGWLSFLAIITERKLASTFVFTANAGMILILCSIVSLSLVNMALIVCAASVVSSALAWCWVLSSLCKKNYSM